MALVIGITGGIGGGKTTVCEIFKLLGIPVFEADRISKILLNTNDKLKRKVSNLFGREVYTEKGDLDSQKLADIVFNNDTELAHLNKIVHPEVMGEFLVWLKQKQHYPYVILEAAILFESGFHKLTDHIILVTAPENERIERVMKRDGVTGSMVRERVRNQMPDEKKREMTDIILSNDNKQLIIPKIIKIDKNLKEHGKIC